MTADIIYAKPALHDAGLTIRELAESGADTLREMVGVKL